MTGLTAVTPSQPTHSTAGVSSSRRLGEFLWTFFTCLSNDKIFNLLNLWAWIEINHYLI